MLKTLLPQDRTPSRIFGFDVETNPDGSFNFGAICSPDGSYLHFFETKQEAIRFLKAKKHMKTIVCGMNIAYDLNTLFPEFNPKRIMNSGRLITLDFSEKTNHNRRNEHIRVIDIGNFIQQKSLKQISKDFGFQYIDIHDIKHPQIRAACATHARSAAQVIEYIQNKSWEYGQDIQVTAPSTALRIFRTCFLEEKQIWDNNNDEDDIEEMKKVSLLAYHGAACEMFQKGLHKNIHMIDVISMYPFCMKKPIPDMNHWKKLDEKEALFFHEKNLVHSHEGMAFCSLSLPEETILPFIYQSFYDKNVCKSGLYNDWLTFPEIRLLLSMGIKICYGQIYLFRRLNNFFDKYIDTFFEMKKKKESKGFAKLMMNSLYGKFGQKMHEEKNFEEIIEGEDIDIEKAFVHPDSDKKYRYIHETENTMPAHSYPLIAAYITAYARIYLYQSMKKIGFEKIIYCDTDSIAFSGEIPDGFIGKNLGNFEEKWFGDIECIRPKVYRYRESKKCFWDYVIKGVSKRDMKNFWDNGFECYAVRPTKYMAAIRNGKKMNDWIAFKYVMNPVIQKRFFFIDGSSRPYNDNDDPQTV